MRIGGRREGRGALNLLEVEILLLNPVSLSLVSLMTL
jgi:hypothetical protein